MKQFKLTFFILIVIISCKNEKKQNEYIKENQAIKKSESTISLQSFTFPEKVQGCSCYFSENKSLFEQEKYIYVDDYGSKAFLKINNKNVEIDLKEGDFDPDFFEKEIQNDEFLIQMKGKKSSESNEIMIFEGNISVTEKSTQLSAKLPFYGVCGC